MPTADLRALARTVGLLKPCGDHVYACPRWCDNKDGRLPTEAEVRAAIFEAGWPVIVMRRIEVDFVSLEICRPSEQRDVSAVGDEAAPDDLVLLALLRALEVVGRG